MYPRAKARQSLAIAIAGPLVFQLLVGNGGLHVRALRDRVFREVGVDRFPWTVARWGWALMSPLYFRTPGTSPRARDDARPFSAANSPASLRG